MNSQTFKENGFAEFLPLKELSVSHFTNNGQVFVLIDKTLSGKAMSDILYIGRAKKPAKKILGGYIGSYGGKSVKKIHSALFKDGYIEKTSISWIASDDPKKTQQELLAKFKNEHGDFPPWNAPRKKATKAKPKAKPKAKAKPKKVAKPKPKTVKPQSAPEPAAEKAETPP